ncbi:hypothetical protein [Endozoicomonas sp. 8E]|uniref:hypothetical protein n=1 Tax=Endozoicomonas sp. 8E TaxID=3035692 RepID=UPI002939115E|nr:hypothetical protein [Endozoicomonas sp. 8E]WOG25659.1 hypothetical protein P6910_13820 [Endozoicomonas sp. 8E]
MNLPRYHTFGLTGCVLNPDGTILKRSKTHGDPAVFAINALLDDQRHDLRYAFETDFRPVPKTSSSFWTTER